MAWGIRAGAVGAHRLRLCRRAGRRSDCGGSCVVILDRVGAASSPRRPRGGTPRQVTRQVVVRAAIIGATTMVASLPFRIARVGGGLDALGNNDVLVPFLRGPIGESTAVTVARPAPRGDHRQPLAAWFRSWWCGAAGWWRSVVSSSRATPAPRTRGGRCVTFDGVHLVAGACWLGGVVALVLAYRVLDDARLRGALVRRFSTWALGLVTALAGRRGGDGVDHPAVVGGADRHRLRPGAARQGRPRRGGAGAGRVQPLPPRRVDVAPARLHGDGRVGAAARRGRRDRGAGDAVAERAGGLGRSARAAPCRWCARST